MKGYSVTLSEMGTRQKLLIIGSNVLAFGRLRLNDGENMVKAFERRIGPGKRS